MLIGFQSVLKIHLFNENKILKEVRQEALTVWNNFWMNIQLTDRVSS